MQNFCLVARQFFLILVEPATADLEICSDSLELLFICIQKFQGTSTEVLEHVELLRAQVVEGFELSLDLALAVVDVLDWRAEVVHYHVHQDLLI